MVRFSMSLAAGVASLALSACSGGDEGMAGGAQAPAREMPETSQISQWVTLFDGSSLDGWMQVGDANWHLVDNYVEADSGVGFLFTPGAYSDFHLRLEFWTDEPANSGVFVRCDNTDASAANCYEVNIYDHRPDPEYRTGAIVDVAPPMVQLDAANQWNTFEITAEGPRLLVRMNGTVTVDVIDDKHRSGPIALQYGAGVNNEGVVRFRNVQLIPL
jgi:hypothetical protein